MTLVTRVTDPRLFSSFHTAMDVVNRAYNRFFESFSEESIKYNERVQNGTHPQFFYFVSRFLKFSLTIPQMDLETQVIPAIGLYLVALAILTFIMKRQSSPVYLKPILLVYNLTCVVLAGSVCVIILLTLPVSELIHSCGL